MKPTPTWPATSIIVSMTLVFGLSVAVWCGELDVLSRPKKQNKVARLGLTSKSIGAISDHESRPQVTHKRPAFSATNAGSRIQRDAIHSGISFPKIQFVKVAKNSMSLIVSRLRAAADQVYRESRSIACSPFLQNPDHVETTNPMVTDARGEIQESLAVLEANPSATADYAVADRLTSAPSTESIWPTPKYLLAQIKSVDAQPSSDQWLPHTQHCVQCLNQLPNIQEVDDPKLQTILSELSEAADRIWEQAKTSAGPNATAEELLTAARLSRIAYDIHRSVSVWSAVPSMFSVNREPKTTDPIPIVPAGFQRWNFSQVDPQWRAYLGLELLAQTTDDPCYSARIVLGRLHSVAMDANQQGLARQMVGEETEKQLRAFAAKEVCPTKLLVDLESFHQRPNGLTASRLNDHFQNCIWSGQAELLALAKVLDNHYRNANIRIAVSESLINRLLAQPHTESEPVQDQILGAKVFGRSQVTNQIGVQMVPDERRWSLVLTASGNVHSRTQAHRDGFVIHSIGSAEVFGSKRVNVSIDGVQSESPQVDAVTDNQVIGLDSPFDNIPILGFTARRLAQRQQKASAPLAEQQVRSRIRSRVQERMEKAVTDALQKARDELNRQVVSRFVRLSLEPQPVEMRTTENELVLRYRLAGFDQMAADTPRPAIDDQMAASLQLHESTINNGLSRLELAGESFTLPTLLTHLQTKLGKHLEISDEVSHDVEVEFAPFDAIRVDFDQDNIVLSIHLKRLQIEGGKDWRNISIQTRYAAQFDGFYLKLQQVGGVRADGTRVCVRDEIAIGAIFDHVLKDEYRFSLLPETYQADFSRLGIQLAHVGLSDGWLSVAYHDAAVPNAGIRQAGRLSPRAR